MQKAEQSRMAGEWIEIEAAASPDRELLERLARGLAHEIRNPLAGIAGVLDVVFRDLPPDSPARAMAGEVQGEIGRINELLAGLVEYTRPAPPQFRVADLGGAAGSAARRAADEAKERVQIELAAPEPALVEQDERLIERALLALIRHAARQANGARSVRVTVASDGVWARVRIEDDGRGAPAGDLAQAFWPFHGGRVQKAGLALPLAQQAIAAHGGRLRARSAPGHGTEFLVELPVRQP